MTRTASAGASRALGVALGTVMALAACGRADAPDARNLLENPGFESGRDGWHYIETSRHWGDFEVVDTHAHSGRRSVHLPVHYAATDPRKSVKVFGVVQEPSDHPFPESMSGWYRVDRWEKSDPRTDLYLQAVIIVMGDPQTSKLVAPRRPDAQYTNYQLRFFLKGIAEPPFVLINTRLAFIDRDHPTLGEWTYFEIPVAEKFEKWWGLVPTQYESLRVLFEARWDNMPPGTSVDADVYFDDLFLGYAGNPPKDA